MTTTFTPPDTFQVDTAGAAAAVDIMNYSYTGVHLVMAISFGMIIMYFFQKFKHEAYTAQYEAYIANAVEKERRKCMCEMKRAEGKCIEVIVKDAR